MNGPTHGGTSVSRREPSTTETGRGSAAAAARADIFEAIATGRPLGDVLSAITAAVADALPGAATAFIRLQPSHVAANAARTTFGDPDARHDARASWFAPILGGSGELLGMIAVSACDPRDPSPSEQAVIAQFAHAASVAVECARTLTDLVRERESARLAFDERDHVARVLQESLLPPSLPEIPRASVSGRFRPGGAVVGGDFYDLFPVRGRDWGIAIGDVCGKGADAAALTALARHSIRTASMLQRQPSRVLAILNEALLRGAHDGRFVTAAYVRLSPTGRGAKIVVGSGGHPPVAVLRAWGDVMLVEGEGSLLGVFDDPGVQDQIVELGPGDSLIFYTDGVTEARRGAEQFGEKRLIDTIRRCRGKTAEQITQHIERAVTAFQSGAATDDIAIVAVTMDA